MIRMEESDWVEEDPNNQTIQLAISYESSTVSFCLAHDHVLARRISSWSEVYATGSTRAHPTGSMILGSPNPMSIQSSTAMRPQVASPMVILLCRGV